MSALPLCRMGPGQANLLLCSATESMEIKGLRAALDSHHYLGAGRPAGHVLWQGVYRQDPDAPGPVVVAVLCWGGAAKRLKARDTWIGWDSVTCANRLKLVVQLRRFVIIGEHREANLASQCVGLALRELQDRWEQRHGYCPLLAESFHDPQRHSGTLYKATNWTALGLTKGFKRHRADFYQVPGYDAINDMVNAVDPVSLATALNAWLREHGDLLPKSLSLDGKDLGSKGQLGAIVTLCLQDTGAPVAMATYSGNKEDCELPVTQQLLAGEGPELTNSVVSADALHVQKNGVHHPETRRGLPHRPQGQPEEPSRRGPAQDRRAEASAPRTSPCSAERCFP